jgi:hypothetical protein
MTYSDWAVRAGVPWANQRSGRLRRFDNIPRVYLATPSVTHSELDMVSTQAGAWFSKSHAGPEQYSSFLGQGAVMRVEQPQLTLVF